MNDTEIAQKKLLKINNKGVESVICNRNVRVLRENGPSEQGNNATATGADPLVDASATASKNKKKININTGTI